jgi:molybdopterin biosynthesis enzyme
MHPSLLPYPERQQLLFLARRFEHIAGLIEEVGNIDRGQRIGALKDQNVTSLQAAQRLFGAQRRQWAFEATQVEGFFGHQAVESSKRAKVFIIAMMTPESSNPRITRLTPLAAVLALIESKVVAVTPRQCVPAAALGASLAVDVMMPALPRQPIALRDGYAVEASVTDDASAYAPILFGRVPPRVDTGEVLPPGTDAIAPPDAIVVRGDRAEAIAAVGAGEGVLPAGADAMPNAPLCRAGARLRALDIAMLAAAGVTEVTIRQPRFHIASGSISRTPLIDAALALLVRLVASDGGAALDGSDSLDAALADEQADAVIAVGGTGSGRNDMSVRRLAERGRVAAHGIAISPGETAAFGWAGTRPVLLLPGRLDAVLTGWCLIGRHLLAKLAGGSVDDAPAVLSLKRKVASTIGMTELVPVRCSGGMAEPLASGYLSLTALTQSDGFIVVPVDSEGFAAGMQVAVIPWP